MMPGMYERYLRSARDGFDGLTGGWDAPFHHCSWYATTSVTHHITDHILIIMLRRHTKSYTWIHAALLMLQPVSDAETCYGNMPADGVIGVGGLGVITPERLVDFSRAQASSGPR